MDGQAAVPVTLRMSSFCGHLEGEAPRAVQRGETSAAARGAAAGASWCVDTWGAPCACGPVRRVGGV